MTGHPLWLRGFWAIHRVMDRLSGGRPGWQVPDFARYQAATTRSIAVVILEPRTAGQ
jgi:hypothetical protein